MASPQRVHPGQRMTLKEYFALGDSKPYAEYLDGIVVRKAMPNADHFDLANEIAFELTLYRREHGGKSGQEGRTLFRTADGGTFYRLPDVSYYAADRPRGPKNGMNPPTLAVEVRSPSETLTEQREKCEFMHANGAGACWLLDPERRTAAILEDGAWREVAADGALESRHLPGLAIAIARLWALLDEEAQA
jgi:Uma2 family endonuclease